MNSVSQCSDKVPTNATVSPLRAIIELSEVQRNILLISNDCSLCPPPPLLTVKYQGRQASLWVSTTYLVSWSHSARSTSSYKHKTCRFWSRRLNYLAVHVMCNVHCHGSPFIILQFESFHHCLLHWDKSQENHTWPLVWRELQKYCLYAE